MITKTDPDLHERCSFCLALGTSKIGAAIVEGEWSGKKACDCHLTALLIAEHNNWAEHVQEKLDAIESDVVSLQAGVTGSWQDD